MHAEQKPEGLVVDRAWITRMYGLSAEWARKELPVHSYYRGRALHLLSPEVVARVSGAQQRKRRNR